MPIKTFEMVLQSAEMIAPRVRHLVFAREDNAVFNFTPGQFINIHFTADNKSIQRSYSIATIPGRSNCIEFAVGHFPGGPATKLLYSIQPGDKLTTSGPFGRLILRDEQPKRYVFVSTSTGITPFRSMLPILEQRMQAENLNVTVLLGVQRREDLIYAEDFLRVAKANPQCQFHVYYSRENGNDLQAFEHRGYVQSSFPDLHLDPETDVVYLCGNPNMIDDAFNQLKDLGFDASNVRREKYISNKALEKPL